MVSDEKKLGPRVDRVRHKCGCKFWRQDGVPFIDPCDDPGCEEWEAYVFKNQTPRKGPLVGATTGRGEDLAGGPA